MPANRLLLTRPALQSDRFAQEAAQRFGPDLDVLVSPVIEIAPTNPVPDLTGFAGLIFTSENAVRIFGQTGRGRDLPAWCVGARTARAAKHLGLDARSADGNIDDLIALIASGAPAGPLLHLHGRYRAGALEPALSALGVSVTSVELYDQTAVSLSQDAKIWLGGSDPLLLPVFSPRSARLLGRDLARAQAPLLIAAMSPAVAAAIPVQSEHRIRMAERPDSDAMLDALEKLRRMAS